MKTVSVTIGNITFDLAPTPISKFIEALPVIGRGCETEEDVKAVLGAVFWGARRAGGNGAGLTREWLEDNVDSSNFSMVLDKLAEVNLLRKRKEKNAPGEMPATTAPTQS